LVEIDGKTLAELDYSLAGNDILIINHTEVDDSLLGKNVGYQLLQHSVDYAREKHFKIMPLCPFANAIFKKKAVAYGDLLKK
jgi:predicted GNAT family acetyltransferase